MLNLFRRKKKYFPGNNPVDTLDNVQSKHPPTVDAPLPADTGGYLMPDFYHMSSEDFERYKRKIFV